MGVVNIGSPAIDRATSWTDNATYVNKGEPASASGTITSIEIWLAINDSTQTTVATFYRPDPDNYPNNLSTRDTYYIGAVTAGSKQNFAVELDVMEGDYIGFWGNRTPEVDSTGGVGLWHSLGNNIPCTDYEFTFHDGYVFSLCGTGISFEPPTVTVQAVTDINETTSTGNGNITDKGYPYDNCTKRGFCWSTSENPDVNDDKSEEIGSFGTGEFSRPMTGLLRGQRYYVKAYAYNQSGYGYSSQVTFYTYPSVTTYAPTGFLRADPTKVTANGLIEYDVVGDIITTRGFKYGKTETDTWTKSSTGGPYGEGTFSLQITTGLEADTTFHIRAYAEGPWDGTWYGSYLEFRTVYPYGPAKTEIKSEATASSGDIAAVGGKRSLTISNHLIQTQTIADLIADTYLDEYKNQKTKLVVTRPTPAPYEIGDTVERISARLPYYAAVSALISYATAADAVHYYDLAGRDMIIRKLNVSFSAGNYVSVIELED